MGDPEDDLLDMASTAQACIMHALRIVSKLDNINKKDNNNTTLHSEKSASISKTYKLFY